MQLIKIIVFLFGLGSEDGLPQKEVSQKKLLDLTSTTWTLSYNSPGFGPRRYDLVFHPGGKLQNFHPNESTPDNDHWSQDGKEVTLRINDDYVIYKGIIKNDKFMSGTAKNKVGKSWEWKAQRKE